MIQELYALIAALHDAEECKMLFDDLCTNKEVEQMAQRLRAAKLLLAGNTYQQVIKATDISSATLSRVSRCVQYGKGYAALLYDQAMLIADMPIEDPTAFADRICELMK